MSTQDAPTKVFTITNVTPKQNGHRTFAQVNQRSQISVTSNPSPHRCETVIFEAKLHAQQRAVNHHVEITCRPTRGVRLNN
jgi:hypothetical protein